jgi:hypothetical protein
MPEHQRIVEVRLLVIVAINVGDPEIEARLKAVGKTPTLARVVAEEVVSNLESTSYVDFAIASPL